MWCLRRVFMGLCDGETGDYGYCGESGVKPQDTQFTQYPHKAAQSDGLQCLFMGYYELLWVTMGYYETYLNS